jgi:hypothetical protein
MNNLDKKTKKELLVIGVLAIILCILIVIYWNLTSRSQSKYTDIVIIEDPVEVQNEVIDETVIEGNVDLSAFENNDDVDITLNKDNIYPDENGFVSLSDFYPESVSDETAQSVFYKNFAKMIESEKPQIYSSDLKDISEVNHIASSQSAIFFTPYELSNCDDGTFCDTIAKHILSNWTNSVVYIAYDDFYIVEYNNIDTALQIVTYIP